MINTTENTHLFLGFNLNKEQPTLIPFSENKNFEIVGKSGSGKMNSTLSILLQTVNNGKPKQVSIISDYSADYRAFIAKGAKHTSNLEEYLEYADLAYEALFNENTESILIIENLDKVIKATNAEVIPYLLKAIEEEDITVIVLGEEKSLLTGLFNITLSQIKGSKAGNFSVSYDNAEEKDSFQIKAKYVDVRKEKIRQLV